MFEEIIKKLKEAVIAKNGSWTEEELNAIMGDALLTELKTAADEAKKAELKALQDKQKSLQKQLNEKLTPELSELNTKLTAAEEKAAEAEEKLKSTLGQLEAEKRDRLNKEKAAEAAYNAEKEARNGLLIENAINAGLAGHNIDKAQRGLLVEALQRRITLVEEGEKGKKTRRAVIRYKGADDKEIEESADKYFKDVWPETDEGKSFIQAASSGSGQKTTTAASTGAAAKGAGKTAGPFDGMTFQ